MPTEQFISPPFPNGAYETYNTDDGTRGIGPVDTTHGYRSWSTGASPYFTTSESVEFKGLIYRLNANWDGTTVGSPDNQVDADGVRVWTLQCSNYDAVDPIGFRNKTINTDSTYYYSLSQSNSIKRYWNYWHNITSAHATVFELTKYKSNTESGSGRNLLTLASTVEVAPIKFNSTSSEFQSINFTGANGIDDKMFGVVTSSCGQSNNAVPYPSPVGIFQYYGNYKKNLSMQYIGTVYYEAAVSYTLATTDWKLSPEYNATAYGSPVTINWTYTEANGNVRSESRTVSDLKMTFAGETFLGRTYTGAYRVYIKDGYVTEQRWELDSVSPDMRTM